MSVIREIYAGEIHFEDYCKPRNEEYRDVDEIAMEAFETFFASLCPEQRHLYDLHESARITVEGMEQEERFRQGFVLGAKLMMEILS